jgi:twitching motility protein PilT
LPPILERLLETCVRLGASELAISVGRPADLLYEGVWRSLESRALSAEVVHAIVAYIAPPVNQQELRDVGITEFTFAFRDRGDFRVTIFESTGGPSIVLRRAS